jgi:hypothetical protein
MAELRFECLGAVAQRFAAAPTLAFALRISETTGATVHAVALRCQLRIEPRRRRYAPTEAERLHDLFGDVSRWGDTLEPMQFTTVSTMVPGFTGTTDFDLPVPCTYDLEVAAGRYFDALDDGEVPLLLLFSGTVFAKRGNGFEVTQVPWSTESPYRLPVPVWREMVDTYFPDRAWITLSRATLDELARFKTRRALPTWDTTVSALLGDAMMLEDAATIIEAARAPYGEGRRS